MYLPLLNSEKIKCLKILQSDLLILNAPNYEEYLNNIKVFFPKKYFFVFYIWKLHLSIDFYVKLMRSYISIFK